MDMDVLEEEFFTMHGFLYASRADPIPDQHVLAAEPEISKGRVPAVNEP
jgi:hypothetical protein